MLFILPYFCYYLLHFSLNVFVQTELYINILVFFATIESTWLDNFLSYLKAECCTFQNCQEYAFPSTHVKNVPI